MKRSTPEEDETPSHVPGLEMPAIAVEGAAIMFRGGCVRLALCEGAQVRGVFWMQTIDAVVLAEHILAGRNEMLRQAMEQSEKGPTSAIALKN